MRHIPISKVERWLGPKTTHKLQTSMVGMQPEWRWPGPPIAVGNMPGVAFIDREGDFRGIMKGGDFMSYADWYYEYTKKTLERIKRKIGKRSAGKLNAGFASFDELIAAMTTAGTRLEYLFQKTGTTGVVDVTNTLWYAAGQPTAGAAASNAPGGNTCTDATTGAFPFANPTGGDTQHLITAWVMASVTNQTLLAYDRLFEVNKTMNSTTAESVTGTPGRYQSSTSSAADYSAGNFLMIETRTALPATAHNWTTCTYTDQDGNTGATLPSVTGNSSAIVNRLDQPAGTWFAPLASGDTGIKALTQMQCSALVASGNITFTIGHPLAWFPMGNASVAVPQDGVGGAFNLARIFDDAAIAFLELRKSATTATLYNGWMLTAES